MNETFCCDQQQPPPTPTVAVNEDDGYEGLPIVSDDRELLKRGICRVKLPEALDSKRWAHELSQFTPMNLGFEGDGENAFYRNILDEPEFPFEEILLRREGANGVGEVSDIGQSVLHYFPILSESSTKTEADNLGEILTRELRLDDAFCVHYNMDQDDTTGAKHMDPSDITINMCLYKSEDAKGSYVLFHGTKSLENLDSSSPNMCAENHAVGKTSITAPIETKDESAAVANTKRNHAAFPVLESEQRNQFLVPQRPGYATIHYGDHPHETTPLFQGSRTNIILTYLYTDPTRSDAAFRSCY